MGPNPTLSAETCGEQQEIQNSTIVRSTVEYIDIYACFDMTRFMPKTNHRQLAGIYWCIVGLFSLLEPWGSIDTRNFSYMGSYMFWEYNAYIGCVLAAMLILSTVLWQRNTKVPVVAIAVVNTMFVVMNLFDLFHFFPNPAQPMPFSVVFIEVVTSMLASYIVIRVSDQARSTL